MQLCARLASVVSDAQLAVASCERVAARCRLAVQPLQLAAP